MPGHDTLEDDRTDERHGIETFRLCIVPTPFQYVRILVEITRAELGEGRAAHERIDTRMRDLFTVVCKQGSAQHLLIGGEAGG